MPVCKLNLENLTFDLHGKYVNEIKQILYSSIIWAASWENLFLSYANNKGADQPAPPRSLFAAWIV